MKTLLSILFLFFATYGYSQSEKLFTVDRELSNSNINQIYQAKDGVIWIATEDGLNRYDGAKFSVYKHKEGNDSSLVDNNVRILFDLDGIPLRAELKVTLTGYCSQKEENKRFPKRSPDVSRMVTLKEGQTLAALCNEVYGDPLLVGEVARFNNLNGYRNVPSGTKILLPMLKK